MSDAPEVIFDAPAEKPARKPVAKASKKRAARKAVRTVAAKSDAQPFPGLTRTACATACSVKGCAIGGGIYCAHPVKGGLQAADMNDRAALKRLEQARAQLSVKVDPDRFK